jgi:integrase
MERWATLRQWVRSHCWSPNRLRHNAGTDLRKQSGIEVAQAVLGHRLGSTVTEIYAEANAERAVEVMAALPRFGSEVADAIRRVLRPAAALRQLSSGSAAPERS